jgi:hypothetical protein
MIDSALAVQVNGCRVGVVAVEIIVDGCDEMVDGREDAYMEQRLNLGAMAHFRITIARENRYRETERTCSYLLLQTRQSDS